MDRDVKLYIHAAAAGFRGGLKIASPLYGVPYRGTAFFLLSWRESAEFEGVECVCVSVLLYFLASNCMHATSLMRKKRKLKTAADNSRFLNPT